jgi:release factor glutamine methyltransferase
MLTIQEILKKSTDFLTQKGIANPRRQAEEVLADALSIKRMQLYMDFDRPLTEKELEKCRAHISRRAKGEPTQYLRGYVEFYDCKIKVTPDVLIPRQETEILVDKIVQTLLKEDLKDKVLWDVCCGSGCIGIAIKKKLPQLQVVISDISPAALAVAKENCLQNEVELTILQGDLLDPFVGKKTHFFVCNPPYVSENEYLQLDKEVATFEPKLALTAGDDGLEFYRKLSEQLPSHLHASAKVWFEIGSTQADKMNQFFLSSIWKKKILIKDWSGKDRFFFLEIE